MKDVKSSAGRIKLKITNLETLKGGKARGFPVPEVVIGSGEILAEIEGGKVRIEKQRLAGESVEIILDGEIALNKDLRRSVANVTLSFKPTAGFLKKEPVLGALLNNIKHAMDDEGFYSYAITGAIHTPVFMARRRS